MKLTCEKCGKTLNIPDSKLTPGKAFSIKCPGCSQKISAKAPASENAKGPEKETAMPEGESAKEPEKAAKPLIDLDISAPVDSESYLEEYDTDELSALVCDKGHEQAIKAALKDMGYRMSLAENSIMAINKMKFNQYNIIIINEKFDDFTLEENPVLIQIQPMLMAERRNIFVVMIGDSFKTMDQMTAFALSVNIVVNLKDINNLSNLLKRGIQENESFYKVYREALVAGGKV